MSKGTEYEHFANFSRTPSPRFSPSSDESEVSSTTPAFSSQIMRTKLPMEVLIQILSHLSFPELYGSAQYVNSTWRHIVTRMILGNAVFLRRIISTDYRKLLQTEIDSDDESSLLSRSRPIDDTWQGVALDTRDLAEFPGLSDIRWRGKPSQKFFLISMCSSSKVFSQRLTFRSQRSLCLQAICLHTTYRDADL